MIHEKGPCIGCGRSREDGEPHAAFCWRMVELITGLNLNSEQILKLNNAGEISEDWTREMYYLEYMAGDDL